MSERRYSVGPAEGVNASFVSDYSPLLGRLPADCQPQVEIEDTGEPGRLRIRTVTICAEGDDASSDAGNHAGGGLLSSSVSIVKSTLGIGLVSMPYACSQVGIVNFVILIFVFALPAHFANVCLAQATDLVIGPWGAKKYVKLAEKADFVTLAVVAFGSQAQWPVLCMFLLLIWGGTLALFIALSDIISGYTDGYSVIGSPWVYTAAYGALVFPLCCLETLNSLRFTSYLGLIGCAALTTCLGYWCFYSKHRLADANGFVWTGEGLSMAPVFVFSYMGQYNFIRIYSELDRRSVARVTVASGASLAVSFVLYAATGVFGYVAFLDGTEPVIFDNLQHQDGVQTHGARVLFAVMLLVTAPVYLFEARNMTEDLLSHYLARRTKEEEEERAHLVSPSASSPVKAVGDPRFAASEIEDQLSVAIHSYSFRRRLAVVGVLLSSIAVVSVVYPHLTTALGLFGATTSSMMMLVLPPLFLLRISKITDHPLSRTMRWLATTLLIFGVVGIPVFTSLVLWKLVEPADAPPPIEPL
ncbi:Vacuolar amino acid transporter 7 [Diplonema papillatum]|nr:Vacuolar amino acid transporter 7 [Diplonema papillatum]|eukprot:gene5737-8778_t